MATTESRHEGTWRCTIKVVGRILTGHDGTISPIQIVGIGIISFIVHIFGKCNSLSLTL